MGDLFQTLDVDGSGTLDLEKLIGGLWRLRARRSDALGTSLAVQSLQLAVATFEDTAMELLRSHGHALRRLEEAQQNASWQNAGWQSPASTDAPFFSKRKSNGNKLRIADTIREEFRVATPQEQFVQRSYSAQTRSSLSASYSTLEDSILGGNDAEEGLPDFEAERDNAQRGQAGSDEVLPELEVEPVDEQRGPAGALGLQIPSAGVLARGSALSDVPVSRASTLTEQGAWPLDTAICEQT